MLLIAIIILAGCCAVSAAVIALTTVGARAQHGANRDVRREARGWMPSPAGAGVQGRPPDSPRRADTADGHSE